MKNLIALTVCFTATVFGSVWAQATGPIDITSQKLEVKQTESKAIFTGNVVVTQSGLTLTAPTVTANYQGEGIQSVIATGGVVITRTGAGGVAEKATGSTATYTPGGNTLVLTGAVTLTRGPSELAGDKLVYNLQTGNAVVTNSQGPVKARFVPAN